MKVPGAGTYSLERAVADGTKYTMGARNSQSSIIQPNLNPGPGTYAPINVTQNVSAKFSIKGKHHIGTQIVITPDGGHEKMTQSCDFNVPGPGTYQAKNDVVYRNFGNSKFGSETRPGMNNAHLAKTPAPNAYDRDSKSCVLKLAPSYGFGSSKRPAS